MESGRRRVVGQRSAARQVLEKVRRAVLSRLGRTGSEGELPHVPERELTSQQYWDLPRAGVVVSIGAAAALLGVLLDRLQLVLLGQGRDVLSPLLTVAGSVIVVVGLAVAWRSRGLRYAKPADVLDVEELLPGDPHWIGGFALLGRVGMAAMSDVYLGCARNGTIAAVKVMRPGLAGNPQFQKRFEQELRETGRVDGPRFPVLLAYDISSDRPWLATKFEPGLTLVKALEAGRPWSLPAVGWLAAGIAEALAVIHPSGVVHRDLKPANVLIDEDGPRVMDFGIAHNADETGLTASGTIIGSFAFMSPEQAGADRNIGPAADIFSLGSLLVYMATARPPFGSGTQDELLVRIRSGNPDLGDLVDSDHPVATLIRKCLSKDPDERPSLEQVREACASYQTNSVTELLPAEVLSHIERRRAALESLALPPSKASSPGPVLSLPPRSRARLAFTTAVAVVAVIASIPVWSDFSSRPSTPVLALCSEPPDAELRILTPRNKTILLQRLADEYGNRSADGRCVRTVVSEIGSDAISRLASGWEDDSLPRPDVWIPASSMWLELARKRAAPAMSTVFPMRATSVMTTPLVIAMPEPTALEHGWATNKSLGWKQVADLATAEDGKFRLGKTNPFYSTSGLGAMIGMFYANRKENQTAELTMSEVTDQDTTTFARAIEQSIVHYGQDTARFLINLRKADDQGSVKDYVSAVALDEKSVLAYNNGYQDGTPFGERISPPTTKLVAFYPPEGTIDQDHPYVELAWPATQETPTTLARKMVARDFFSYLHSGPVQARFQALGFRDYLGRLDPKTTPENGVDPKASIKRLPMPNGAVIEEVLSTWTAVRKPARVLFLIDTTASMNMPTQPICQDALKPGGRCLTRLELLKQAWHNILPGFTQNDSVGLWTFSDHPVMRTKVMRADESGKQWLLTVIDQLTAGGGTALYDATNLAVEDMAVEFDKDTINAVVVISDGRDEGSALGLDQLLTKLQLQTRSEPIRVFTVSYGLDSAGDVLEQIAETTGAVSYDVVDPNGTAGDLIAAMISNF